MALRLALGSDSCRSRRLLLRHAAGAFWRDVMGLHCLSGVVEERCGMTVVNLKLAGGTGLMPARSSDGQAGKHLISKSARTLRLLYGRLRTTHAAAFLPLPFAYPAAPLLYSSPTAFGTVTHCDYLPYIYTCRTVRSKRWHSSDGACWQKRPRASRAGGQRGTAFCTANGFKATKRRDLGRAAARTVFERRSPLCSSFPISSRRGNNMAPIYSGFCVYSGLALFQHICWLLVVWRCGAAARSARSSRAFQRRGLFCAPLLTTYAVLSPCVGLFQAARWNHCRFTWGVGTGVRSFFYRCGISLYLCCLRGFAKATMRPLPARRVRRAVCVPALLAARW